MIDDARASVAAVRAEAGADDRRGAGRAEAQPLLLIGASGHAKVVTDAARAEGRYRLVGCLDHKRGTGSTFEGLAVLGDLEELPEVLGGHDGCSVVVAIGDNGVRRRVTGLCRALAPDVVFGRVVHPSAVVASTAVIGDGSVVFATAVVNPGAVVGEHVILNTGCSTDHDCRIASFASLAPGVRLGGDVEIGEASALGIGASVIQGVTVGSDVVVGAGAVVLQDVPDSVLAYGVPARPVRPRSAAEPFP